MTADVVSVERGPRARAVQRLGSGLLVVFLAALMTMLADPRPAMAFAVPPVIPVSLPGSVAEPLVTAAAAVGGAGVATAVAVASGGILVGYAIGTGIVCMFTSLPCSLPWGQDPRVVVNPGSSLPSPNTQWFGDMQPTPANSASCATSGTQQACLTQSNGSFTISWSNISVGGTDGYYAYDTQVRNGCGTVVARGGHAYKAAVLSGSDTLVDPIWPNDPNDGCGGSLTYSIGREGSTVIGRYVARAGGSGTVNNTTAPDPSRATQPYRKCTTTSGGDGSVVTVYGTNNTYTQGTARLPLILPACPGDHPVPFTFGSASTLGNTTNQPVQPAGVPIPAGQPYASPSGTPVIPSGPAWPSTYPGCPSPWSCTVGRPVPGGPALLPLPGGPKLDPTQPDCAWGPYAIPSSDCDKAGAPDPAAPAPNATTTGTGTVPDTSGDGTSCGGSYSWNPVSWVLVPVKCALRWAFVPSAGVLQSAETKAAAGFTATGLPAWGTAFGAVGTSLAGLGSGAGGCAGPHFVITLGHRNYAFDPLNACSMPMSGVAFVVKLFATLAVIVGGYRLCARPILASFGMGGQV